MRKPLYVQTRAMPKANAEKMRDPTRRGNTSEAEQVEEALCGEEGKERDEGEGEAKREKGSSRSAMTRERVTTTTRERATTAMRNVVPVEVRSHAE
ncbi:hypothetical protein GUJ93_ZPchr0012g19764 [Zizania palustris]|uniref:Uncharacterized protein n=1 Tax=Zizania palustris TaxID=103762 RepID=A0A8J6BSD5_ZIZPA|nr:hypothetical protein GUJ93_ZPchr0012g19764 [Zizania palustris]